MVHLKRKLSLFLYIRLNIGETMHVCAFGKTYVQDQRIVQVSRDGKQWNKAEWNEMYAF